MFVKERARERERRIERKAQCNHGESSSTLKTGFSSRPPNRSHHCLFPSRSSLIDLAWVVKWVVTNITTQILIRSICRGEEQLRCSPYNLQCSMGCRVSARFRSTIAFGALKSRETARCTDVVFGAQTEVLVQRSRGRCYWLNSSG